MKTLILSIATLSLLLADGLTFAQRSELAQTMLTEQHFAAALEAAKALNRELPDDTSAYRMMAEAQLGLGDYEAADRSAQWMLDLKIGKADSEGWRLIAQLREVTGDPEGAMQALNLSYERLLPAQIARAAALHGYASHLLFVTGKLSFAEAAARQSLKSAGEAGSPMAMRTLAQIYRQRGQPEEAITILRELVARFPDARNFYLLAEASKLDSDVAKFLSIARAGQQSPKNANRELVLYLSTQSSDKAEALTIARSQVAKTNDVYSRDALAVALQANGNLAEARKTMREVLTVGTRDPEIVAHAVGMGLKPE